jgi:DNA-binding XRE family transcriptional regulator
MDTAEIDQLFELKDWLATGRARQIREEARLTQAMLGRALGVTKETILNWEGGKRLPQGRFIASYHELLVRLAVRTDASVMN